MGRSGGHLLSDRKRRRLAQVIDIGLERRRISLSLKQANEGVDPASEDFDPSLYGMAAEYDEQGHQGQEHPGLGDGGQGHRLGSLDEPAEQAQDCDHQHHDHDPREGDAAGLPRLWVIGGGSVYEQALADGLPDVLVISVLDLDATQRARERGLPDSALVRAPGISTQEWAIDPALSDPRGQWRPASGDARWRVETWRHL